MGIGREVSAHYLYNYIVYIDCGRPLVPLTVGWAWGPELYINPFLPLCQLIIHSKIFVGYWTDLWPTGA